MPSFLGPNQYKLQIIEYNLTDTLLQPLSFWELIKYECPNPLMKHDSFQLNDPRLVNFAKDLHYTRYASCSEGLLTTKIYKITEKLPVPWFVTTL